MTNNPSGGLLLLVGVARHCDARFRAWSQARDARCEPGGCKTLIDGGFVLCQEPMRRPLLENSVAFRFRASQVQR